MYSEQYILEQLQEDIEELSNEVDEYREIVGRLLLRYDFDYNVDLSDIIEDFKRVYNK